MRTHILTASVLLIVPLASACAPAGAATPRSSSALAAFGVAGDCAIGDGPMQPAAAGATADRNQDGYMCGRRVVSIAGDSLLFYVDNDASVGRDATTSAAVWSAGYSGM